MARLSPVRPRSLRAEGGSSCDLVAGQRSQVIGLGSVGVMGEEGVSRPIYL